MYELSALKQRSKYYHADIKENNKNVYLSFFKANVIQVTPLSKDQGFSFIIKVPENDYNYGIIKNIEEYVIQQIIENNGNWFNNDLSEEIIRESFKSTLSGGNINIYYSTQRPPDSAIFDFEKWYNDNKYNSSLSIRCKIKCEGVYIYPKKFLLRWIITAIDEYDEDVDINEIIIDNEERQEIEKYWKDNYETFIAKLNQNKQKCMDMLVEYKNIQEKTEQLFKQIDKSENMNEWDLNINKFKNFIMSCNENKNIFF